MTPIDLRSDTVTRPDAAMREAIARAEVGDDVYGEDPTINGLQQLASERLGKEAALFVPSGTMANQVALRAHTRPGDAAIVGRNAHMFLYESGGAAAVSGVQMVVVGDSGLFTADEARAAVFPADDHFPRTRLVCVENTHNRSGGRIFPLDDLRSIARVVREHDLRLHLDGARLFNAEVATGVPVAEWAAVCDSVSFCLSKGLGAPVGSLITGSRAFIERAHRVRKMLGGGMRQVGLLGAAGIHALEHNVKRLADDHRNARRLAEGLREIDGVELAGEPETNMVLFRASDPDRFATALRERGLLIGSVGGGEFRAVTHLDVDAADVEAALGIIRDAAA
jgi:threonine aldolase